jgi:hypothetical protein
MASRRQFQPVESLVASSSSSSRSYSPAPSSSSSSSSLSTTSTHTVVPTTPGGNRLSRSAFALTSLSQTTPTPSPPASVLSDDTATPRTAHVVPTLAVNGTPQSPRQRSKSRTVSSSASSAYASLPRTRLAHQAPSTTAAPSLTALLRASLRPYLTRTRVTTFLLLFVLVPLISFVLRMRRRRLLLTSSGVGAGLTAATATAAASASTADLVRRRLGTAGGSETGVIGRAWGEVLRVVGDTVRMAGSGLV